jgi:integrase
MLGEGYLHKSPVPRGVRPKVAESLPNPLTEEEVMKVLAVGGEHAFAARIILASGFRWSDVVRLQATDLKSDGKLTIACSKTGKVLRAPLGQSDQDLYQEIRQRVGPLVPFSVNAVGSFNKTVRRRSGVKRFGSYRLRDTFACRWLDRGGSLTDLQAILGHADPATTMRYGRPSDERIASEATRMALHAGQ